MIGLVDLLLGSEEAACPGTNDAIYIDEDEHQLRPALLCQGVNVDGWS